MKLKSTLLIIISFIAYNLSAQNVSWYKCLKGTIDKYPITMHLHKMDHNFSGYYYYNSKQEPIYFIGEDTSVAGKIKLFGEKMTAAKHLYLLQQNQQIQV